MAYEPTIWNNDDVITAEKLNKLEQGVQADAYVLPAATTTTLGGVKQAAAVADVASQPTMEEFNALLASLRSAGILATS